MKKQCLFFVLTFFALALYGQQYVGELALPKIEKNGFYRIAIQPTITGYLLPDFANLRLTDKSNREVPYLIKEEIPVRYSKQFHEYDIERFKTKKETEIVLKNPTRKAINNIQLKIRNADVVKEAILLGSDDHENWFALKQKFKLHPVDGGNGTSEMKVVEFPTSNYLFYSLRISDSLTAPLNVINVGYYEANTETGQYTLVPAKVTFSHDDLKKQSRIELLFDTLQFVDRIDLKLSGQKYFFREGTLQETRKRKVKKGRTEEYSHRLSEFKVSSTQSTQIDTRGSRYKQVEITIENNDSPPLELSSIQVLQLNRYVIAWLSANVEYKLKIGDDKFSAPSYDLAFFKDSIPKQVTDLNPSHFSLLIKKKNATESSFFNNSLFIWASIVIVASLLAYMAIKMGKDLGKPASE
jgi:hypothetical protein